MTLKELREIVNGISTDLDDAIIICQKDSDGNGYSPLSCVDDNAIYIPNSTRNGEVYDGRWTAEECCLDEAEWLALKTDATKRAIIFAPTN